MKMMGRNGEEAEDEGMMMMWECGRARSQEQEDEEQ